MTRSAARAGLVLSLLLNTVSVPALAETDGAAVYAARCAVCHGIDGRGHGPYELFLTVAPADLTRLSAENDGRFPFEDVYRIIDGRTELRAHGPREMPIWGYEFRRLAKREGKGADAELEVTRNILALIDHLRDLQTE